MPTPEKETCPCKVTHLAAVVRFENAHHVEVIDGASLAAQVIRNLETQLAAAVKERDEAIARHDSFSESVDELTTRIESKLDHALPRVASLTTQLTAANDEVRRLREEIPEWIVNSLGELGVCIRGRCFFLYKGTSIEYKADDEEGFTMLYRNVGKREFGETCWPTAWHLAGRILSHPYTEEVVYQEGLSNGAIGDLRYQWKPLIKEPPPCRVTAT